MTGAPDRNVPPVPARVRVHGRIGWLIRHKPFASHGCCSLDGEPGEQVFNMADIEFVERATPVRPTLATVDGCDVRGLR